MEITGLDHARTMHGRDARVTTEPSRNPSACRADKGKRRLYAARAPR